MSQQINTIAFILFLQDELERIAVLEGDIITQRASALKYLISALENDEPPIHQNFCLGCLSIWRQQNIKNYDSTTAEEVNSTIDQLLELFETPLENNNQLNMF